MQLSGTLLPLILAALVSVPVHAAPVALQVAETRNADPANCFFGVCISPAKAKRYSTVVTKTNCGRGVCPGTKRRNVLGRLRFARQDDGDFDDSGDDGSFDDSGDDGSFDDSGDDGSFDDSGDAGDDGSFDDSGNDSSGDLDGGADGSADDGSADDSGFGGDDGSLDDGSDDAGADDDSGDLDGADGSVDDGSDDGSLDGLDGSDDGSLDDGSLDSSDGLDGSDDGSLDGADDGSLDDGSLDGSDDGSLDDGSDDGSLDGTDDSDATATSTAADSGITDAPDGTDDGDDGDDTDSTTDSDSSTDSDADASTAADSASSTAAAATKAAGAATKAAGAATKAAGAATKAAAAPPSQGTSAAASSSAAGQCSANSATTPNAATISLIKQFEGFVASPAPDPIGLPTAGFGHKCVQKNCAEVTAEGFSFPLSQATASQLLSKDLGPFMSCVNSAVSPNVKLNDNQVGALASFSFNLGCGTLKSSTLLKRLNAGEDPNTVAAAEIPRFNKAGGKVLSGLVKRRAAEVQLFQTPSNVQAHPC